MFHPPPQIDAYSSTAEGMDTFGDAYFPHNSNNVKFSGSSQRATHPALRIIAKNARGD